MSKKLLIAAAILLISGLAHADRNQLFLGAGAGFGVNNVSTDENGFETEYNANAGLVTSFKIGRVINQQHAIYYQRQASRFLFGIVSSTNTEAISGITGIGYTYYVSPTVGSPYIEAALGFGDFIINVDGINDYAGRAFLIGGGYELSEHVQVGGTFEISSTTNPGILALIVNHSSIAAKVEFKL